MLCVVTADAKLYIPLSQLIDVEKELARLAREKANCLKQIAMFEGKLSNEALRLPRAGKGRRRSAREA